jgi:hypothetical protein
MSDGGTNATRSPSGLHPPAEWWERMTRAEMNAESAVKTADDARLLAIENARNVASITRDVDRVVTLVEQQTISRAAFEGGCPSRMDSMAAAIENIRTAREKSTWDTLLMVIQLAFPLIVALVLVYQQVKGPAN